MNFISRILTRRTLVWPLLAIPGLYILWHAMSGESGIWEMSDLQSSVGQTALFLLMVVLSLTPLKVLFPQSQLVAALNHHRRGVGLSVFAYGIWHASYFFFDAGGMDELRRDLVEFPYLQAGLFALLTLVPLALTSSDWATRLMGWRFWKALHRLAYVAVIVLVIHRIFAPEADPTKAVLVFLPLAALEAARVIKQMTSGHSHSEPKPDWDGWRDFEVARKVSEAGDVYSFYLRPSDGKKLKPFQPGQYLTLQLMIPGQEKPVIRCYSLSDAPQLGEYRITVKRVAPPARQPDLPPGLASNYLHDHVQEGDAVSIKPPAGQFVLNPKKLRGDVVLIAGGIGLTPVLSMLNAIAPRHVHRAVWFFYGVRFGAEHVQREQMKFLANAHPNVHLVVCYSDPQPEDEQGRDYQVEGRVSVELFKELLPGKHFDFFYCGPPPMMQSLTEDLDLWGVEEDQTHYETFGPASVKKVSRGANTAQPATVLFEKSHQEAHWSDGETSLLELAEENGIVLPSGCRAGNCGTCSTPILSGEVDYLTQPSASVRKGSCLTCIAVPKGDVVLEA